MRAVLSDKILFRECIFYLREDLYVKNQRFAIEEIEPSYSCLSTTFEITKPWVFDDFTIYPSYIISLPAARRSILNFVKNPLWIKNKGFSHPQLFGEVLGSVVSFVTLKPVKSPRDDFRGLEISVEIIPQNLLETLAFTLPFISAGPGGFKIEIGQEKEDQYINEINDLLLILKGLNENDYLFVMEVFRLIQLSILVARDDLGLSFLLLVSAIEAVSQKAIKRKSKKHAKEDYWKEKAKDDEDFGEILQEYKDIRGRDKFLGDRFVDFILKYTPVEKWDEILEDDNSFGGLPWIKSSKLKDPIDMTKEELSIILKNAYQHRSEFVHQGTQPPHRYNELNSTKFFEVTYTEDCPIEIQYSSNQIDFSSKYIKISPKYELMLNLAKHSILKWLNEKYK